ncbi:YGR035C [Saccharomyces arboricola H-6]|uniref:YGR035C n=1 Tax=Saccharomyces arboricola (strain H-6 / AS 2.3317 / CBS 10644) TaxID=1160507 RepID=J8Q4Z8_SACAR|nr:YGR035C [Saccharomyces arboricola H-6]
MLLTQTRFTRTEGPVHSEDNSCKISNSFMRSLVSSLVVRPISSLTNTVTNGRSKRQSARHNSLPNKITRHDLIKAAAENDLKRSKSQGRDKPRRSSNSRDNEEIILSSANAEIQRTRSSI